MQNQRDQESVAVEVMQLPHGKGLPLPAYATVGSAGLDLLAATEDEHVLEPGDRWVCPTGLQMAIPEGFEGQVRSRSGWALKQGVICLNSPGTIDSDYRGEVGVILANLGSEPVSIARGTRVAQFVLAPVSRLGWRPVEALDATVRGAGGFGSTGTSAP